MRIIGGSHRGRRLAAPSGRDTRPTSDRTREALFNILAHSDWGIGGDSPLPEARVLDVFCGTGALGLEALSRGAGHCTFLDGERAALAVTRRNVADLGEEARATIIRADATQPPAAPAPCRLVFLDPPYGKALTEPALRALTAKGWLAPGAVVVTEIAADDPVGLPEGFSLLDERLYGETRVIFARTGAWSAVA